MWTYRLQHAAIEASDCCLLPLLHLQFPLYHPPTPLQLSSPSISIINSFLSDIPEVVSISQLEFDSIGICKRGRLRNRILGLKSGFVNLFIFWKCQRIMGYFYPMSANAKLYINWMNLKASLWSRRGLFCLTITVGINITWIVGRMGWLLLIVLESSVNDKSGKVKPPEIFQCPAALYGGITCSKKRLFPYSFLLIPHCFLLKEPK